MKRLVLATALMATVAVNIHAHSLGGNVIAAVRNCSVKKGDWLETFNLTSGYVVGHTPTSIFHFKLSNGNMVPLTFTSQKSLKLETSDHSKHIQLKPDTTREEFVKLLIDAGLYKDPLETTFKGNWSESFLLKNGTTVEHTPQYVRIGNMQSHTKLCINVPNDKFKHLYAEHNSTREEFIQAFIAAGLLDIHTA